MINDTRIEDSSKVKRVVICSGKVFYDLDAAREASDNGEVAVVRLEQFYPFPSSKLNEVFASYPSATELVFTQEEPQNMGGWAFVEPRLREIKPERMSLNYIGRAASASPATGSYAIHGLEQHRIIETSLSIGIEEKIAPAGA